MKSSPFAALLSTLWTLLHSSTISLSCPLLHASVPAVAAEDAVAHSWQHERGDSLQHDVHGDSLQLWTDQVSPLVFPMDKFNYTQIGFCDGKGKALSVETRMFRGEEHAVSALDQFHWLMGVNMTRREVGGGHAVSVVGSIG